MNSLPYITVFVLLLGSLAASAAHRHDSRLPLLPKETLPKVVLRNEPLPAYRGPARKQLVFRPARVVTLRPTKPR